MLHFLLELRIIPLFWKTIRITLFYALSELSGGTVSQILKHAIDSDRPIKTFANAGDGVLPLVENVTMHHSNSFPAGHTSTFFIFSTCCALLLAYRYRQREKQSNRTTWIIHNTGLLMLLAFAALGGYSRIYLSQHFLLDVCVGSIIGFVTPCLLFQFAGKKILKPENKMDN